MTPRRVQTVGYLLWHLSTKWRVAVDRALDRFGLTHAHTPPRLAARVLPEWRAAEPARTRGLRRPGGHVRLEARACVEHGGLLRRADHPDDPRAFQLELTARGADRVVDAAAVMRELYDQLLRPIGGRTGKRHAALMQTLRRCLTRLKRSTGRTGPGSRSLAATCSTFEKNARRTP